MNQYYKSPEGVVARVKEELRGYFNTNATDDLLFPIYIKDCIDKFENTYVPIEVAVIDLCGGKCELPCDFKSVREVWLTATYHKGPVTSPHVFYYQTDCRITPSAPNANDCGSCQEGYQCFPNSETPTDEFLTIPNVVVLPSLCDVPERFRVTHKVMTQLDFEFEVTGMLMPGNFNTLGRCHSDSPNRRCSSKDTFDIVGNKLITSFHNGTVVLYYYAEPRIIEENGYLEIPNNDPFEKYLYHYLRYMMYVQLVDQSTEENYKLLKVKRDDEKVDLGIAYINAKNYAVSGDIFTMIRNIKRGYNYNNRFRIS